MSLLHKGCIHPTPDQEEDAVEYTRLDGSSQPRRSTDVCCGCCGVRACIIGTSIAIFFIFILPAGLILMFLGSHRGRPAFIGIGAALVTLPLLLCPSIFVFLRWRRLRRKDKRAAQYQPSTHSTTVQVQQNSTV